MPQTTGTLRFDDSTLFTSDRQLVGTEISLVIFGNRRNDRDQRRDQIGRVKPAAQTDFDDSDIDVAPGKIDKRHDRDEFKKSQRYVGCGRALPDLVSEPDDFVLGDLLIANANPLG